MASNNDELDLSSFPLLRIGQIHLHTTATLVESEAQLSALEKCIDVASIEPFLSKLLRCVKDEILKRRDTPELFKEQTSLQQDERLPTRTVLSARSTRNAIATKRSSISKPPSVLSPGRIPHRNHGKQVTKASPTVSFFVPTSRTSKSPNFRSRSKQAKASLQARSHEAFSRQREEQRNQLTHQALDRMQEWRSRRERSKQQREELLEEEKRQRLLRREARQVREERIRSSMAAAAEEAKLAALQTGSTQEEAIVEAAAAAAKIADDESTCFNSSTVDFDDDESFLDDSNATDDHEVETDLSSSVENESAVDNAVEECKPPDNVIMDDCAHQDEHVSHQDDSGTTSVMVRDAMDGSEDVIKLQNSTFSTIKVQQDTGNCTESTNELQYSDEAEEQSSVPKDTPPPLVLINDSLDDGTIWPSQARSTPPVETEADHAPVEERVQQPIPKKRFTSVFPSFAHLFTKFTGKRSSSTRTDIDQRELDKCMQAQIDAQSALASLMKPGDDSDGSSDCNYSAAEQGLFYRINSRRPEIASIMYKVFSDCTLSSSWNELPQNTELFWNLQWTWGLPKAADFEYLLVAQRVSRFRLTHGLTRKDLLKKNIQRFASTQASEDSFNIMPLTYALPHEFNSFVSEYQKTSKDKAANVWIIKPIGLSRGRGISLVNDIANVSYSEPIVIQRYIADPLKFLGYKFDLRIYVLVTSFHSLEAFIYKEGLARFGTRKYSSRPELINDNRIHLTNSSIQKEFEEDIDKSHPASLAGSNGAESKVAMSWLLKRLADDGIDTDVLWERVVSVCVKALVAASSDIPHQPNSFEVFGFDVMFDEQMKCWLIEVNSSPSMSCDSALDTKIKGSLIRDAIALVDPPDFDRQALADVCSRRLTHRKAASNVSSGDTLEKDLARILKNKVPRAFGAMPRKMGNFQRIAPDTDTIE